MIFTFQLLAQTSSDAEKLAKTFRLLDATTVSLIVLVVVAAIILSYYLDRFIEGLSEGTARRRFALKKAASFSRFAILCMAIYLSIIIFVNNNPDSGALLGLGGTLAVALGFALKDTASSVMAGLLILLDQPFQVGDRVSYKGMYGEVKNIGLRTVRVMTLNDDEVSIPNNVFLTEAVSCSTGGALEMMVVTEFYIAMTADFESAKKIVYEAVTTSQYVFLQKPVTILIADELRELAAITKITAKAYVVDARYEKAFQTDITERVKRGFRKVGVRLPFQESNLSR